MSPDNVAIVRRWYEALNAGDADGSCALLAPDFELIEPSLPDAGAYRGEPGLRKWLERIDDAWSERRWQVEEFTDWGDWVLVTVRFVATGAHSGLEQASRKRFQTIRVRDGRIALATGYGQLAKARAAVGLPEP
jgi:ketosteroid isomerase-like protein